MKVNEKSKKFIEALSGSSIITTNLTASYGFPSGTTFWVEGHGEKNLRVEFSIKNDNVLKPWKRKCLGGYVYRQESKLTTHFIFMINGSVVDRFAVDDEFFIINEIFTALTVCAFEAEEQETKNNATAAAFYLDIIAG